MVNANVIQLVGTSYIIRETSRPLGKSELEAILYLEDEKNVDTTSHLKGLTQDALRKPKLKSTRKITS